MPYNYASKKTSNNKLNQINEHTYFVQQQPILKSKKRLLFKHHIFFLL